MRPGGLHSLVLHAGRGPRALRAAVTGRRFLDDDLLPPVEHVRARPVYLVVPSSPLGPGWRERFIHPPARWLRPGAGESAGGALAPGAGLPCPRRPRDRCGRRPTRNGNLPSRGCRPVPTPDARP